MQVAQALLKAAETPEAAQRKPTKKELQQQVKAAMQQANEEAPAKECSAVAQLVSGFREFAQLVGPDTPEDADAVAAAEARMKTLRIQRDFGTQKMATIMSYMLSAVADALPNGEAVVTAVARHSGIAACMNEDSEVPSTLLRELTAGAREAQKAAQATQPAARKRNGEAAPRADDGEACTRCGRANHTKDACFATTMAGTGEKIMEPMSELASLKKENFIRTRKEKSTDAERDDDKRDYRDRRGTDRRDRREEHYDDPARSRGRERERGHRNDDRGSDRRGDDRRAVTWGRDRRG